MERGTTNRPTFRQGYLPQGDPGQKPQVRQARAMACFVPHQKTTSAVSDVDIPPSPEVEAQRGFDSSGLVPDNACQTGRMLGGNYFLVSDFIFPFSQLR